MIAISFAQPVTLDKVTSDKNFNFIDDFEKNKATFASEKFDLWGHSSEGGQLIAFHNKEKTYLVVDIWIFGELGKINATYWTDKDLNFIIVKRIDFEYDKPFYEKDFKATETTKYLSYNSNKVKSYNGERKELSDLLTIEMKKECEEFFKDVTKGLKIQTKD
jgi:hypothetical protein